MEHVQYTLEETWPQLKTLNELYILLDFPSPFKEWELSIHVGRRGQVQKKWRKKKPNFYTEGLEFVLLQKLDRGIQRTSGPYKFVGREGSFIVLEDSKKRQFAHPEFIERRWRGSLQYRSTAATIWSSRCLCQLCETSMPGSATVGSGRTNTTPRLKQAARAKTTEVPKTTPSTIAKTTAAKRRRGPPKQMQVSVTIGQIGADIEPQVFEQMAAFLQSNADMGVTALERGDSQLQLHIQGMLCIKNSSVRSLKDDIKTAIDWHEGAPLGASICVKSLTQKGLHTVLGMIGYCHKDEDEMHFRVFHKNVTDQQIEEGRKHYVIHGACAYKNRVELHPTNILNRAMQFRRYRCKNPVSISFRGCLRQMLQSCQYIPALRWLVTSAVSRERAETLWRAATVPDSVTLTDVVHIFFARIPQSRYYEPKHPAEVIHEAVKYAEQREEALRYGEGMQGIYDEDEPSSDPKHESPNPDVKHDSRKSEQRLDDSKSEDNVKGVPLIDFTKLEPRDFDPQNTVPLIDFDTYDPREFNKPALKQDLLQAGYALGYRSDGSNESIGYMPDSIPLAVFR
ncbi:hypothetical protein R1sor_008644 [Riccia sorocarpa]|uniref:Replitron HUH endonuclease domain-containing protein n=1 Tax=Riccia sorocarpa TaxID=122646 RepID=A0ABD3HU75_9MARC